LRASGASCEQVAEHLAQLERGPFGCSEATAARNMAAARTLCGFHAAMPTNSAFSAEHPFS
jgi:hypothetical protein